MPLDLSGVDAELEALGSAPDHAVALARSLAGIETGLDQLQAIDRELGLLELGIAAPSPGSATNAHSAQHARAQPPVDEPSVEAAVIEAYEAPRESGPAPAGQSERAIASSAGSDGLESWPPLAHSEPPPEAAQDDSPLSAVHSVPPPALTQSQEIVLPDPIPREELSTESGELRLDDEKPSSGSFSLDEESPESASFDSRAQPRAPSFGSGAEPRSASTFGSGAETRPASSFSSGAESRPASSFGSGAESRPASSFGSDAGPRPSTSEPPPPARPRLSQFVTDDVGEALEGSQPISIGNSKLGPSKAPPFSFDRDPDAEFDALLSEATDPSGMPTDAGDSEVDELLQGLGEDELGEDLHADLATTEFNPEASAETEVHDASEELALLMLEEPDDATEVLDRATLGAIESHAPAITTPAGPRSAAQRAAEGAIEGAAPAQEDTLTEFDSAELEMGELEILMDETPTKAPPPPPPPPAGGNEKRPSGFLGRIFGRGERE
jgi:hypothetical protein